MVGYCSTGRLKAAMAPASMMTMAITQAKTGRSMKKRERAMSAFEDHAVQGLAQGSAVQGLEPRLRRLPKRHAFAQGRKTLPRQADDATPARARFHDPDKAGFG